MGLKLGLCGECEEGAGVEARIILMLGIGLIRPILIWDAGRACFTCLRKWVVESHVDVSLE